MLVTIKYGSLNSLPHIIKIKTICRLQIIDGQNGRHHFYIERNICGKSTNAGYQHFLPLVQCFQKTVFPVSLKLGIVQKLIFLQTTKF